METFYSFLEKRVDDCSSLLCVGLDPHVSLLEKPIAASALDFCLRIVKETSRYAVAFKPNAAFFEFFGSEGWTALKQVFDAIQVESDRLGSMIPIILDAKRGDIASTAEVYAKSAFKELGAHAITLNPYLGRDSINPFLEYPEKGVFLLCKTSNPSAGDLQDLSLTPISLPGGERRGERDKYLYEHVAHLAQTWNTARNIGLVVGATQPEALTRARAAAPDLWFLSPGVGAQGGNLHRALESGLRQDGRGMLVSVSRSIAKAENPGLAAAKLRDKIINITRDLNH